MDEYQELIKSIENAQQGYWMPITILSVCFSVIIALLLYIWNQMMKSNEARHQSHEEVLKSLADSQKQIAEAVVKLETKTEYYDKQLK
jgi:uncharacterized protein YpmB